eukprot:jgi/Astpho2/459/e_gw1.00011.231.1_t
MAIRLSHFLAADVECVATGHDHNSRQVAQFALVDEHQQVLLNVYVRPDKPVVSYLTPLTSLTAQLLQQQGMSLQQGLQLLRQTLPKQAILVGQNIRQDVQWLGLQEGTDFQSMVDLAGLYRVWNPKFNSYSVFGQDHVAKLLLSWNVADGHDAVGDAMKSIALFKLYQRLKPDEKGWTEALAKLLAVTPEPSFARQHPCFEGVCMGGRKTCTCGAPFFS